MVPFRISVLIRRAPRGRMAVAERLECANPATISDAAPAAGERPRRFTGAVVNTRCPLPTPAVVIIHP